LLIQLATVERRIISKQKVHERIYFLKQTPSKIANNTPSRKKARLHYNVMADLHSLWLVGVKRHAVQGGLEWSFK
jgi:hypothetical protein